MKLTLRQLKAIILEAFDDDKLKNLLSKRRESEKERPRRRISRINPKTGRPFPKSHAVRGLVRNIGDEPDPPPMGVATQVTGRGDVQFDPLKARSLTKESPFVAGSPNFNATYHSNYTEADLTFFIKKIDPETGERKRIRMRSDYPDHQVGEYVIIPALFSMGLVGVMQITGIRNLKRRTISGEEVDVPVLFLKSITPESTDSMTNVGKAFVKKVGGRSKIGLDKAKEAQRSFVPRISNYRE